MKQLRKTALLVFTIVFTNFFTLLLSPYPHTLFTFQILSAPLTGVNVILTNLIIFCAHFLLGTWLIARVAPHSDMKKSAYLRTFLILLAARIIVDVCGCFVAELTSEWTPFVPYMLHIIYTIFMLWILLIRAHPKPLKKKRYIAAGSTLLLSITGMASVWIFLSNKAQFIEIRTMMERYKSFDFDAYAANMNFTLDIHIFLLNVFVWIFAALLMEWIYKNKDGADKPKLTKSAYFARVLVFPIILFFLTGLKYLTMPIGSVARVNKNEFTLTQGESEFTFHADYTRWRIERLDSYYHSKRVSDVAYMRIMYGNTCLLKYSKPTFKDIYWEMEDISVADITASRYGFEVLAYMSGDKPNAILMKKINAYSKKDETLIRVLETLIEQSYFEAFEYSYQYLLRYDRDFIMPYIQKYANGDLTGEEQELNGYLHPRYMTEFAQGISY